MSVAATGAPTFVPAFAFSFTSLVVLVPKGTLSGPRNWGSPDSFHRVLSFEVTEALLPTPCSSA